MDRCRVNVVYSGHVQGVGFRYTVKSITPGYELTGIIRNLPDGRVELIAEGCKTELEEFLLAITESGLGRLIKQTHVTWGQARNEFRGFEITG